MTDDDIKKHFIDSIVYKYVGKLEDIKDRQRELKNTTTFLKDGKNVYFSCQKPCEIENVVVAFDTRTTVLEKIEE